MKFCFIVLKELLSENVGFTESFLGSNSLRSQHGHVLLLLLCLVEELYFLAPVRCQIECQVGEARCYLVGETLLLLEVVIVVQLEHVLLARFLDHIVFFFDQLAHVYIELFSWMLMQILIEKHIAMHGILLCGENLRADHLELVFSGVCQ